MEKGMAIRSLAIIGMFILLVSFASAFAVGSRYWRENPILISSGETADFFVVLQNIAGEGGDVSVQGFLTEGGDIARFTEDSQIYFVPFGSKKNVNLIVTAPENAVVGEIRNIVVSFKIILGEGSEMFGLGSSVERTIPVKIVEAKEPESVTPSSDYVYYIIALIVLVLVVIIYVWIKKKR